MHTPRDRRLLAATACLTLAACDIPSGLPRIQTRLVVPGEFCVVSMGI